MFFQILGAIAEFEHALMSERTMDGLAAARSRSRTGVRIPLTCGGSQVLGVESWADSAEGSLLLGI
jgi:DNA invertase Pin-like site-specific DNA recombinase